MELADKQDHIIRCVKLGMSLYDSMIVAQCTEDEISLLEENQTFNKKVKLHQCLEEKVLLEKFNKAMEANLKYGNTKALEKKLSKINPGRWDDKRKDYDDEKEKGRNATVNINLKGVFPGV